MPIRVNATITIPRPTTSHPVGFITFLHIPNQPPTTCVDIVTLHYGPEITITFVNIFIINMPGTQPPAREEFMEHVNGSGPDGRALPAGAAAAARMLDQEIEVTGPGVGVAVSGTGGEGKKKKKKSLPRRMMDKVGKIIRKT